MYQNFNKPAQMPMQQNAGMPTSQPQQKPQTPQKTKFTVDDLMEIMNVIMPIVDYPGAAMRAVKTVLPPGNYNESMSYGEPPSGLMRAVQYAVPPAPRPRLLPTQQAVLPPGYYE